MAEKSAGSGAVARIEVRIQVGSHLMAATDDPVFLGLRGPEGREFRLKLAKGRSLRRGHEDVFVFAGDADPDTNVEHPDLNDPTQPRLDAAAITGFYLRKGFEPIPNVRALGEMDDRLEVVAVEVTVHSGGGPDDGSGVRRFERQGPLWLGLVVGLHLEIPPADRAA